MNQDSSRYEHSTGSPDSMFKLISMGIIPATTSRVGPTEREYLNHISVNDNTLSSRIVSINRSHKQESEQGSKQRIKFLVTGPIHDQNFIVQVVSIG